jgi:TM2 domain-containing membrane protein YozV
LSIGIFADINLNSISENKTEITIELRRKLGTFNEAHEVTNANNHIALLVKTISEAIVMSDEQINVLKQNFTASKKVVVKSSKDKKTTGLLCFFLGVFGVHRFYTGHYGWGFVQFATFGGLGLWVLIDLILILTGSFKDGDGNILV